jgi:hypothetical protein
MSRGAGIFSMFTSRDFVPGGLRAVRAGIRTAGRAAPEIARAVRLDRFPRLGSGGDGWKIKFDVKHLAGNARFAMVGDRQWQHVMAIFCQPFTKAKVQYFDHTDVVGARKWLTGP